MGEKKEYETKTIGLHLHVDLIIMSPRLNFNIRDKNAKSRVSQTLFVYIKDKCAPKVQNYGSPQVQCSSNVHTPALQIVFPALQSVFLLCRPFFFSANHIFSLPSICLQYLPYILYIYIFIAYSPYLPSSFLSLPSTFLLYRTVFFSAE